MGRLIEEIHNRVMGGTQSGGSLVITKERHRALLSQSREGLERACGSLANNLSEDLVAIDVERRLEGFQETLGDASCLPGLFEPVD